MRETTLSEILSDFETGGDAASATLTGFITIRLPSEAKARYDRLQAASRRRFGKKAREAILALIAAAEAKSA